MTTTAELHDGRILEFPDGTDPLVIQDTVKKVLGAGAQTPSASNRVTPTDTGVAVNAANKALAGFGDMFLNAPTNLMNIGKSIPSIVTGQPLPELTPTPDYASRAMQGMGLIKPELDPNNTRQRLIDAGVQGAVGTAMAPARSIPQMAQNAGTGLISGLVGRETAGLTGSDAAGVLAAMATPLAGQVAGNAARSKLASIAEANAQNAVRNETLNAARKEGYVTPPTEVNPSFWNNRLESIGGKAAVRQEASLRNQKVTNEIAAKELGLPASTPLTEGTLVSYRQRVSEPYREVAAIDRTAATALEHLKDARFDANEYRKFYARSGDPQALKTAQQAGVEVERLEGIIEQSAISAGKPELVQALKDARQSIAKSYDIERALNLGDAGVSAPTLGRAFDSGKKMTGGLKTIAAFAQGPGKKFVQEGNAVQTPGVSHLEMYGSPALATMGASVAGPIGAAVGGGLPFLRGPVRSLLLSEPYQNAMANPIMSPGSMPFSAVDLARIQQLSPTDAMLQSLFAGRSLSDVTNR